MFLDNVILTPSCCCTRGVSIKSSPSRNATGFIIISCPLSRDARDVVTWYFEEREDHKKKDNSEIKKKE